ncbi:MAG: nucleotidyltransferase domain-containing protein [Actinobacteria bacterium]|nr:nucleotidyltransferase domain-containing protein [Actinomycetota bacterium]
MNTTRLKELNKELDRIVDIIIKKYNPIKIILYGSIPSGKIDDWSDIDLIVIKNTDKSLSEKALNYEEDIVNFCMGICI